MESKGDIPPFDGSSAQPSKNARHRRTSGFGAFPSSAKFAGQLQQEHFKFVSAHTRLSKILEILEDDIDLRSLLRFLVPALFGNLPDRRGHSWGIKVKRFWWSFSP